MRPAVAGSRKAGSRKAGKPDVASDQSINTQQSRASVSGSVAALTYGLVYPWGVSVDFNGWGVNGGAVSPINKLEAYPHLFPADVTIKEIIFNNQISGASIQTRYKLGIYSNFAKGTPYPLTKLAECAEFNLLGNDINTTRWSALNLSVSAGTILWMVHYMDNTNSGFNLASLGGAQRDNTLLGVRDTMATSPIIGWAQTRTYDGTLPTTYPQTAPTAILTSQSSPAWMMRYG